MLTKHSLDCSKSLKTPVPEVKEERVDSYDMCSTQGTLKPHVQHTGVSWDMYNMQKSLYCFLHHGCLVLVLVFRVWKSGETDMLLVRKYGCKRQIMEGDYFNVYFLTLPLFNYLYAYVSIYVWVRVLCHACGGQRAAFRIRFSSFHNMGFIDWTLVLLLDGRCH